MNKAEEATIAPQILEELMPVDDELLHAPAIRPGDHACIIYRDDRDRMEQAIRFIKAGLERGDRCTYIVNEGKPSDIVELMTAHGVDTATTIRKGALLILRNEDTYLQGGSFDINAMMRLLGETAEAAVRDGFAGLSITGEIRCQVASRPGSRELLDYEARVNDLTRQLRLTALCQYDKRFPAETLADVIRTHPLVVYDDRVCRNKYYVPPEEFLNPDPVREVDRLLSSMIDRQREEESRWLAEKRLGYIVHSGPAVVCTFEPETGATQFVSNNAEQLLGYAANDFLRQPDLWVKSVHPDDLPEVQLEQQRTLTQKTGCRAYRFRHADGDYRWIQTAFRLVRGETGEPVETVGVTQDITAFKAQEAALAATRTQTEQILTSMTEAFFTIDSEGRFTYLNPKAEELMRRRSADVLGVNLWEVFPESRGTLFETESLRAARENRPLIFEAYYPAYSAWYEVRVYPTSTGQAVYFMETTERRRREEELRQAQKMQAVGQLAGGVAHDFNNLLTIILGYAAAMKPEVESSKSALESLEAIEDAGRRAAWLTRQLLAFSRKQVLQPRSLNLNSILQNLNKVLERLIGEDIELITTLAADLGPVWVDQGQIEQIVLNLVLNSRDAMPTGGRISITTENTVVDETFARSHDGVTAGAAIRLSVSDTGTGMDSDTLSHMFEPFFTTKEPGKGTGMGLSIVHGIVKQSGGSIFVDSEPGKGTQVRICFPRFDGTAAVPEPSVEEVQTPFKSHGGETILVIEDEDDLRSLIRAVLSSRGYTVFDAKNGEEGLLIFEQHPKTIRLVISDVILKTINGPEVAQRLRALDPELKVLFMSGYNEYALADRGIVGISGHLLEKPFAPDELLMRVLQLLEQ